MKKFWIVLISLAMVAAFCMPASAVDVKFSGSYYIAGDYYSDVNVVDDGEYLGAYTYETAPYSVNTANGEIIGTDATGHGYGGDTSTAFFRQRLRVQTEFVVSPGLSLITRFDALEKIWGDQQWTGSRSPYASRAHMIDSDATSKEQENIEFEQVYIQYMSKVGLWWIGLAPHDFWGTTFGDSTQTEALIQWILPLNQNWIIGAKYFKHYENNYNLFGGNTNSASDADDSAYVGVGIFKTQDIEAGLKVAYRNLSQNRDSADYSGIPPYTKIDGWLITPYFKGQFGPVNVQTELEYWNGEVNLEGNGIFPNYSAIGMDATDSIDMEFWSFYLDAKVDIGPAYVGGRFIYVSGDDRSSGDKFEGSDFLDNRAFEMCWGGIDLKQTLILWNEDVTNWVGDAFDLGPGIKNAQFYQIYGGYTWKDFSFTGALAYAKADETYRNQDDEYGYELDVTASYKITNNLTYMVGAGYLWTGDYFKYNGEVNRGGTMEGRYGSGSTGGPAEVDVDDIYVLTNKLTLTF